MTYILIQNDGEIESNAFELIGASTKRGDGGKIGFFGSGLKYSIAYMMRHGIAFRIFSGLTELEFSTIPETLKDQTFDRICINGKPTSYTVTMGPTWTEDWFVLREIFCNALDETNSTMLKDVDTVKAIEGKTRIYIETTDDLLMVSQKWDAYFATDREPLFSLPPLRTTFLDGKTSTQSVQVFRKTHGVLYRKGVRVGTNSDMMYDYGFEHVDINEDRTARHLHALPYIFVNMMAQLASKPFVISVLRSGHESAPCREYTALRAHNPDTAFSSEWIDLSREYLLIVSEQAGKYADDIQASRKEALLIPQYFAKALITDCPEVTILGIGRTIDSVGIVDVETTPKMNFLLEDVRRELARMNYHVPYSISIVQFDDDTVLGKAGVSEKRIYLSERIFDMGRREIAMTIMEETEHINSGKEDETRAFQNHLISSWLTAMENANQCFL